MKLVLSGLLALPFLFGAASPLSAQELIQDTRTAMKARVLEVLVQEERIVPGTDTPSI